MEKFNLYTEALIFISVFSVIILLPCFFTALIGREMIDQIGRFPTKTSLIQVKALFKLVVIEIIAFSLLASFYRVFAN